MVVFFHFSTQRITGEYNLMKKVDTGLALSGGILPRMNQYISTGTRVMAISAEPIMEKVFVNASG